MTEKEKMVAGEMYDPLDPQLVQERIWARQAIKVLNEMLPEDTPGIAHITYRLIPNAGKNIFIQAPFYCDYGYNIITGENVFINFNCVILDVSTVHIGSRTMFGPNVQVYTATHPLDPVERSSGREYAKPIVIGSDVWVGGSVVICPGVSIGDRTVIGAGSVVTKDLPPDVFAAGNPCKVIRQLNAVDK